MDGRVKERTGHHSQSGVCLSVQSVLVCYNDCCKE